MKQSRFWLLAMLSGLMLMATSTVAVAEEDSAHFSGSVEIGATVVDVDDNPARVQEYTEYSSDDGVNFAPNLELHYLSDNLLIQVESDIKGPRDQKHGYEFDYRRFLRLDGSYDVLEYWQDHETLDQMGATARDDIGGSQPSVLTDKILAELQDAGHNVYGNIDANGVVTGGVAGLQLPAGYDPEEEYLQEVNNDYIVTRKELKNEADLALPFLPNVVFHAGMRLETREGLEQAIGVTKCDACHVTAEGKEIDETTEEYTFGATGKFGLFTVMYEYLMRDFTEDAQAPTRYYEDTQNKTDFNLIYPEDRGEFLPFNRTPDSEKDSHSLKARVDFSNDTVLNSSYVKSDIESNKSGVPQPDYDLLQGDTLETEYESYGAKLATRFENLRLALRGSVYEIEASDNTIYFPAREGVTAWPGDTTKEWHTAEAREVTELGLDGLYRLGMGTTLSLGYEYEEVDREEEEFGTTETHTLKGAAKTRFGRALTGRLSYKYQNIDDPFSGAHVGIGQGDVDGGAIQDPLGSGLWFYNTAQFTGVPDSAFTPTPTGFSSPATWYWTAVYPNRQLESGNLPEDVHEAKVNATWAARPNLAATLFARVRFEENDHINYEQDTYVPGASLWYAPTNNLNLTMAYTFNKQETENKMCVGWYHG